MTDATPRNMDRIIFVVGNSRSGTTMMGRVLGRHPSVFTFSELHFFEQMWNPAKAPDAIGRDEAIRLVSKLLTIQRDGYYTQRNPQEYAQEASRIVDAVDGEITPPVVFAALLQSEAAREGKTVGCDQTPRNLYYLRELLDLYPQAHAVVMVRDPRDVLLSQKNRWKRRFLGAAKTPLWNSLRTWAGYHPITISMLWRSGMRAADRLADHPRVSLVRFEDLLTDSDAHVRRLCDRLGLTFDADMLDVPRVGSSHRTDQPQQTGIDPGAAGQWRQGGLTDGEIAICQRMTGDDMQRHGYDPQPVSASMFTLALSRLTWLFKSAMALLLNIRRAGNLRETLRRRFGGS